MNGFIIIMFLYWGKQVSVLITSKKLIRVVHISVTNFPLLKQVFLFLRFDFTQKDNDNQI